MGKIMNFQKVYSRTYTIVNLKFTWWGWETGWKTSFGHCVICSSSIYGFWYTPLVSSNSSYSNHDPILHIHNMLILDYVDIESWYIVKSTNSELISKKDTYQLYKGWNRNRNKVCVFPKTEPEFPTSYVLVFFMFIVQMRGDCSFCWYWWNCWPSLFKISFYNCMYQGKYLSWLVI